MEKKLFYLIAQRILIPNPPIRMTHPTALPAMISNPPTRMPAAGPVPALNPIFTSPPEFGNSFVPLEGTRKIQRRAQAF